MRLMLFCALIVSAPAAAAAQTNAARAAASITPEDYLRRLSVIAHDSMGGRDTPSPGLTLTAQWIAGEFERMGLAGGGGDGGFIQQYPLERTRLDTAASHVAVSGGPTWPLGSRVIKLGGSDRPEGATGAAMLISGAPPAGAGGMPDLPLAGTVAVVVLSPNEQGGIGGPQFGYLIAVARQNPAAVIAVADVADAFWERLARQQAGTSLTTPWTASPLPPVLLMRPGTLGDALPGLDAALARTAGAPAAAPAGGAALTVTTALEVVERFTAPNVAGILRGRDPALRDEYVVYSAHMDHVGTGRPVNGDSIYNGADDDASGTTAIVEVAEAFTMLEPAPRRSVIFLLVSGEEKGLWGSDYFAAHPPVPVEQMVANLNADMVGRNWTDTIVAIGKEHSDLGQTLARVNEAHPELGMTAIDDLWPQERFYFRSDHFNFARRGVPVLFFFNGTHPDYHRPSDHVDLIDEEKATRISQLLFYLGLEIANADERPRWNPESYEQIVDQ